MPCKWQMHEGLPAFYQQKAMVEDGQSNPQERLMTSSSLKSPAEMPHCKKAEQDSTIFEMLHLRKAPKHIFKPTVPVQSISQSGPGFYVSAAISDRVLPSPVTPHLSQSAHCDLLTVLLTDDFLKNDKRRWLLVLVTAPKDAKLERKTGVNNKDRQETGP
ncbi:hypothetical protein STEG23_031227 [Scotinomys teguina]